MPSFYGRAYHVACCDATVVPRVVENMEGQLRQFDQRAPCALELIDFGDEGEDFRCYLYRVRVDHTDIYTGLRNRQIYRIIPDYRSASCGLFAGYA